MKNHHFLYQKFDQILKNDINEELLENYFKEIKNYNLQTDISKLYLLNLNLMCMTICGTTIDLTETLEYFSMWELYDIHYISTLMYLYQINCDRFYQEKDDEERDNLSKTVEHVVTFLFNYLENWLEKCFSLEDENLNVSDFLDFYYGDETLKQFQNYMINLLMFYREHDETNSIQRTDQVYRFIQKIVDGKFKNCQKIFVNQQELKSILLKINV